MKEFGTVLGGIGLLIFAYLAFTHANGVVSIAEGIAKPSIGVISALQGNAGGSGFVVA